MPLVSQLIAYGLRQVIGEPADAIVIAVVTRLTNPSQTLPKALASANDRAWQAVGIALAGDGFLDQIKVFFAGGVGRDVREQGRSRSRQPRQLPRHLRGLLLFARAGTILCEFPSALRQRSPLSPVRILRRHAFEYFALAKGAEAVD